MGMGVGMDVGMIVPVRMPVVVRLAKSRVMMMGGGRDGNHAKNVIL